MIYDICYVIVYNDNSVSSRKQASPCRSSGSELARQRSLAAAR